MDRKDKVWWNNIAGPVSFRDAIIDTIVARKNVILQILENTPWRSQLRYSVEEEAKTNDYEFVFIDYSDDFAEGESLLKHVIRRLAPTQISGMFREGIMKPYLYIKDHKIIRNKVVWVKGVPDYAADDLLSELAYYASATQNSNDSGVFVIEIRNIMSKTRGIKNTEILKYEDFISTYDTLLFAYFISAQTRLENRYLKEYQAHLSSELFGYDSEICYEFLQVFHVEKENPLDALKALYEKYTDTPRGTYEERLLIQHPFYLLRENNESELLRRIWKSQVQVFFPYTEQKRIEIIEENQGNVQYCLPRQDVFGNLIRDPMEVELGLLAHISRGKLNNDEKRLVTDFETRSMITVLHNTRNKLAHLDVCDNLEIMKLFQMS